MPLGGLVGVAVGMGVGVGSALEHAATAASNATTNMVKIHDLYRIFLYLLISLRVIKLRSLTKVRSYQVSGSTFAYTLLLSGSKQIILDELMLIIDKWHTKNLAH